MSLIDKTYCNLPWKAGGRSRTGLDCAGLAQLWLTEQMDLSFEAPASGSDPDAERMLDLDYKPGEHARGDVIFFRLNQTKKVCHVGIILGDGRILHILKGCESRIDVGTKLIERLGFSVAGVISGKEAERICVALKDASLGGIPTLILLAISIALSLASTFLLRPKLGQRNLTGRYGFDSLVTQTNSELPLPDVLGAVTLAGNSPYQSMIDKSQPVTDETQQKANFVVVMASGPVSMFDANGIASTINGTAFSDAYFFSNNPDYGFAANPTQDKADCVTGTIGSDTNRPSYTDYLGTYDVSVPIDVRAQYDRDFPIYGFSGCAYRIFRLIDSSKFSGFNLNTAIAARLVRSFNSSGFITASDTTTATGDGSTVRFKLNFYDLADVTSVTVNGTAYTPMSAASQTGNVYSMNFTKGYVEFVTAPAASAAISVTYDYYPRAWSNNPAALLVYLLTEPLRGKGFPASKINWQSAVDAYNYCAASITWTNATGSTTAPRYTCNYAIDSKKPIQDHISAVLDSFYGYLFLSGGQFYLKARKSETAVMDFNASNIIAGSFTFQKIDRTNQCNRVHVFFRDTATYNVEDEIIRDDATDQRLRAQKLGDNGIVEQTLHLPAIDNQPQAERYSEQILRENVATRWTCQFTTNIKGLAVQPGDVITVTHPAQPSWSAKLFRIEEHNYDANDQLVLNCSEYFDGAYI